MPQTSLNVYIGRDSEASNAMIAFQWALTCDGRIFDLDGETSQDNIQQYLRSELLRRNMGEDNPGVYRIESKPAFKLTKISVDPWIEQGIKSIVARVFDGPFLEAATAPVAPSGAARRRI